MKRIKNLALLLMAVMTMGLFSACEPNEDVHETFVLSGEWEGDFHMSYDYEWRDRYGRINVETFRAYSTNIVFYPHHEYATYGTGTQVDFYRNGPYRSLYYKFRWEIRNGVICLRYPYEHNWLDTDIHDYALDYRRFEGYFGTSNIYFCLYKLADFDWRPYVNDYGYTYYDEWGGYGPYYQKSRSGDDAAADSTDAISGRIVRYGVKVEGKE